MTSKYIQREICMDYTPDEDVSAGDIVVVGDICGVARLDIKAGELGTLLLRGIVEVPKRSTVALNAGAKVWWATGEKLAVVTASTYPVLGYTLEAAPEGTTSVKVMLANA